jgi:intermediate peptidase
MAFLQSLAGAHMPIARKALQQLQNVKKQHNANTSTSTFQPWDLQFYSRFLSLGSVGFDTNSVTSYFSIGRCFEMMSFTLESLFGISLRPASLRPGETWHEDVRKLDVYHPDQGKIGTIYCDLFERRKGEAPKFDNPAHFTVRCSRKLHDNPDEEIPVMKNVEDTKILTHPATGKQYRFQLPIVVLVTGFSRPFSDKNPTLLRFQEVETLFHEMGHAIHSMLARTDYQHISGTRVPMDFVEVASIFLEQFAKSPAVVSRFASHYETGEPLDMTRFNKVALDHNVFDTIEAQNQIQIAILDQAYHSERALEQMDTSEVFNGIQSKYHVLPFVTGTAWQVQFTHLFTYGASYYSYLWSRRWALRIHEALLKDKNPNEWAESGELINRELLGQGGSRDPWIGLEILGVVKDGEKEGRYAPPTLLELRS